MTIITVYGNVVRVRSHSRSEQMFHLGSLKEMFSDNVGTCTALEPSKALLDNLQSYHLNFENPDEVSFYAVLNQSGDKLGYLLIV